MSEPLPNAKKPRVSTLRPAIRAILERTRKARAELDALIGEPDGTTETGDTHSACAAPEPSTPTSEDACPVARRKAPKLDNNRSHRTQRDPKPAPRAPTNGRRPAAAPDGDRRNPRRRQGVVQPLAVKTALVALFKPGLTIEQVMAEHPDVSKGTLVAVKANVTRGAYK